jgi:RND family efflux transporter MFP subunit
VARHRFRSIRLLAVAGSLAAAHVTVAACGRAAESDGNAGVIAVMTQAVRLTTLRDSLSVTGTVTAQASADFVAIAPETAEIAEMPKQEGETVQAGDLIVRLDIAPIATEVATRQLALAEAEAGANRAQAEVARVKSLVDRGFAPRNMLDSVNLAQSAANTSLTLAKAAFDTAKAAEARQLILAPFSGIVTNRWHAPGDLVAGGEADPILRIVDPSRLQVAALVPLSDSARIQLGQTATIQTVAGGEAAIVAVKLPPPTATSTTAEVRLNFVVPTTLPIDSPVQVDVTIAERASVIVVPADAVQRSEGLAFVWVPNDNGQAVRREVRVGLVVGNLAEITSGLAFGDMIIVTGLAELVEGTPIVVGGGLP